MSDEPSPGYNSSPTPSVGSTGSIGGLAPVVDVVVEVGVDAVVEGDVDGALDGRSTADVVVVASGSAR
jgi:hypothetical protein